MAFKAKKGRASTLHTEYKPVNPEKYKGRNKICQLRSSWEIRIARFFDLNPNILEWSSESLIIPYFDPVSGKNRRYFPDFLVTYKNSKGEVIREIVEVKPATQTRPPKQPKKGLSQRYYEEMAIHITNLKKWEAAKHYAEKKGYNFRILTENEIFGENK